MPRYYFHVFDGQDFPDDEGVELLDDGAAKDQAILAAGDMLREIGFEFWDGEGWVMKVVDETDRLVGELEFSARTRAF